MNLSGKKINFLGDSITEGVGTTKIYADTVAEETGAVIRNYGISGTRISRQSTWHTNKGNQQFDQDYCERALAMDPDADIICVFGGTNDFGHGDAVMGTMEDRDPRTFYGGMHTLCTELINKYPKSFIFFMTPLHRADELNKNMHGLVLYDYIKAIREVCEFYSIPVLDLYKNSGIQPMLPVHQNLYVPDGLHPNEAGHRIMADLVEDFLQ